MRDNRLFFFRFNRISFIPFLLLGSLGFLSCATQKPIVVSFPVPKDTDSSQVAQQSQPAPQVQASSPAASGSPAPATPDIKPGASPAQKSIPIPVTEYNTPDNSPTQPAPTTDKDIENLVMSNNIEFEIKPQQQDYQGGAVLYNYVPQHIYRVFVAPLQLTTVLLEPGENLVSAPAAGDTSNFMVASSVASEDGRQREEIYVKAVYPGKQTTLSINTSKRSYFLHLYSYEKLFMPLISFNYPLELADKIKQEASEAQSRILMYGRVTDLDFSYQIIPHSVHKPAWMPDRVFNDGKKTYMSFPSASRAGYAPVLFEVNEKNERTLLNYRVIGTYYIVDRVLRHAELVLDINEGNIVTIVHRED